MTTPPGLRLLVIDDEPDIIEVTRVSLELLGGHSVITASSARQGLILAQDAPPDAELMDVNLADMSAMEAIQALGTSPATAAVPVILFTGEHADALAPLREQPNVAGFIGKPFSASSLGAQVAELVQGRPPVAE